MMVLVIIPDAGERYLSTDFLKEEGDVRLIQKAIR